MQIGGIQPISIAPWYRLSNQTASAGEVIPQASSSLPRNFDTLDLSGSQMKVDDAPGGGNKTGKDIQQPAGLEKAQATECQTCANRAYQDGSDDPSVSFQSAQKIDPKTAATTVMNHEMEHVYNEKEKAKEEGREVVSQNVTLKYGICPECGKLYVAGGETRTVTKSASKPEPENQEKSTEKVQ